MVRLIVVLGPLNPSSSKEELSQGSMKRNGWVGSTNNASRQSVELYQHNNNGMRVSSSKNSNTSSVVERENSAWMPFFKRCMPCVK